MSDLISRQAAIDALKRIFDRCEEIEAHLPDGDPDKTGYKMFPDYMTVWKYLRQLPPAQPELITVNIDHELTQEEYEKLRKDMANAPLMLSPTTQRWIPCSERLPMTKDDYIITVKDKYGTWTDYVEWSADYHWWEYDDDRVIAWMPLPEPYKGEES